MKSTTIGAISEMVAATELLKRGYNVLMPMDPGSPYDMVVEQGGKFIRVQVKTARKQTINTLTFNSFTRKSPTYVGLADVFVVVHPDTGSIYWIPVADVKTAHPTIRLPDGKPCGVNSGLRHQDYILNDTPTLGPVSGTTLDGSVGYSEEA